MGDQKEVINHQQDSLYRTPPFCHQVQHHQSPFQPKHNVTCATEQWVTKTKLSAAMAATNGSIKNA